jgi:glycosyltransferase involved in cell wall biosynthesis
MPPRISVIIPAYNATGFVGDCLASVAGQRPPLSLEVIAVNDGSTDGTLEKLRSIDSLTCLTQANLGPAAARNAGIRQARGDYIAFLDADDLWPPDKLRQQLALLERHPDAALCFGDCRQFTHDTERPRTLFEEGGYGRPAWGDSAYVPDAYAQLLRNNFITTGSVVVRRRVLEAMGGFDESLRLVEDLELWLRIARQHPVVYCDTVCLLRRRHAGNTSREAEAMSLAYLDVLRRQQDCCGAELARRNIRLAPLQAREYRDMAGRALAGDQPGRAVAWAWRSLTFRPSPRALWYLLRGLVKNPGRR